MRRDLMNVLACPIDHCILKLIEHKRDGDEIEEGILTCSKCKHEFPIKNGIPILMPDEKLSIPEQWWTLASSTTVANFMRGIDPHQQPIRCRIRDEAIKVGKSVLDVGCATCIDYPLFYDVGAYYVGVDFTYRFLLESSNYALDVPVVQGNARKLPFKTKSFDSVYCKDFILHLPPEAYKEVLKEMWRVTRKLLMIGFFGFRVEVLKEPSYKISDSPTHGPVHWNYYPKVEFEKVFKKLPRFNDLKVEHVQWEGKPIADSYRSFFIVTKK